MSKQEPAPPLALRLQMQRDIESTQTLPREYALDSACLQPWQIEALAFDTADEQERLLWEAHCHQCPRCAQEHSALASMFTAAPAWDLKKRENIEIQPVFSSIAEPRDESASDKASRMEMLENTVGAKNLSPPTGSQSAWHGLESLVNAGAGMLGWASVCVLALVIGWQLPKQSVSPPSPHDPRFSRGYSVPRVLLRKAVISPKGPATMMASRNATQREPMQVAFQFFLRRGMAILGGRERNFAKAGDQLRFAYRSREFRPAYLVLFVWDAKGQLTWLYPEPGERPFRLLAGDASRQLFLPGGVSLDDAGVNERIFVCVSRQPISQEAIKRELQALSTKQRLAYTRLSVPCGYQTSWLLMRKSGATRTP